MHASITPRLVLRRAAIAVVLAITFLAGGIVLPRVVSATVSSGDRDSFFPVPPARVMDTRFGPSPLPVGTKLGAGQTVELVVAGQGGVSAAAKAVALNVTVTNASAPSHLTLFPAGTVRPNASNLNFAAGDTIPNSVVVKLGAGGKIAIFNNAGNVDVIVDVNGYYEDANFDDRYYTKAAADANDASAITTPGHVHTAQLADNAILRSKVAKNTLGPTADEPTVDLAVAPNGCTKLYSGSAPAARGMLVMTNTSNPMPGTLGDLYIPATVVTVQQQVSVVVCNSTSSVKILPTGSLGTLTIDFFL